MYWMYFTNKFIFFNAFISKILKLTVQLCKNFCFQNNICDNYYYQINESQFTKLLINMALLVFMKF